MMVLRAVVTDGQKAANQNVNTIICPTDRVEDLNSSAAPNLIKIGFHRVVYTYIYGVGV